MKNIFVVNSIYHTLTAFILTHSILKNDDNYLVIMRPPKYETWENNEILKYISSKECGYKDVFVLLDWLMSKNRTASYRQQVKYVKENIRVLDVDNVFIGVDTSIPNQLFVEAIGKNSFYRIEDGMYSYFNGTRRRKKSHVIFHKIKAYLLKWVCGIEGNMYLNTEAEGESPAGKLDIMYKPWLLQRRSPATKEITIEMINEAMKDLKSRQLLKETFEEDSILYLSQPMVEMGNFTLKEEAQCLEKIIKSYDNKLILYYKPHPHDNPEKIKYYKEHFKWIRIYKGAEPAEIIFAANPKLKAVISYQSSALINVDKFSNNKVKAISLSDIFKTPIYPIYKKIMQQSDIFFPKSVNEIIDMIKK